MDFFQKNKLLIAILSVVIFVFGIGVKANAEIQTIEQLTENTLDGGGGGNVGLYFNVGELTGSFESLKMKYEATKSSDIVIKVIRFSENPTAGGGDIWTQGGGEITQSGEWHLHGYSTISSSTLQVDFSNEYGYLFRFYSPNDEFYGTTDDNYENGRFFDNLFPVSNSTINDAYFVLKIDVPPTDEIEITSPVGSAPGDFENWEITFDTATTTTATTTDAYVAYIYGGYTPDPALQAFSQAGADIIHSFQSPKLIKNHAVYGEGSLYAHAKLFYQPDRFFNPDLIQQVATSSVINFTITPTSYAMSFYPTPTSVATSSEWVFTCDPESGFFANSLCNMFRFVFVPTTASVNRFGDLGDTIKSKPPFGYWGKIKDEIQDINATAPAFVLAGASVLAENTIFINIRTMTSILLWFLFGFWILHRIRKFNF